MFMNSYYVLTLNENSSLEDDVCYTYSKVWTYQTGGDHLMQSLIEELGKLQGFERWKETFLMRSQKEIIVDKKR